MKIECSGQVCSIQPKRQTLPHFELLSEPKDIIILQVVTFHVHVIKEILYSPRLL